MSMRKFLVFSLPCRNLLICLNRSQTQIGQKTYKAFVRKRGRSARPYVRWLAQAYLSVTPLNFSRLQVVSGSIGSEHARDVYHHFEYPKSTLASIRRALKDDGHLVVIDFERIEGTTRKFLMGHVRAGKEVFLAEILEAGFTLVEEKKINGFQENYFLKFRKD